MGRLRVSGVVASSVTDLPQLRVSGITASGTVTSIPPRLRISGLTAVGPTSAVKPKFRTSAVTFSGSLATAKGKFRLSRINISGDYQPTVSPISPQTVDYDATVSLSASVVAGTVENWVWRQVSGPTVALSYSGSAATFKAPAVFPPGGVVRIGVTAYSHGIASDERTVDITVNPQVRWRRTPGGEWKPGWWLKEPEAVVIPPTLQYAGAAPIGTAEYTIPGSNVLYVATGGNNSNSGTIGSPKATVLGALAAATAGTTIVVRGGTYGALGTINKQVRIQNYPGEEVWFDGGGTTQLVGIINSNVWLRGIGFRNFNVTNDSTFERGLVMPSAASNSLIENCHFVDFGANVTVAAYNGTGPLRVFSNADVIIRKNTFLRSGVFHIYTNKTTGMIVENNYFKNANTLGHNPQPLAAAVKHCRAYKAIIRNNYAADNTNGQGFWLDVSCYDCDIYSNYVEGGYEAILIELSGTVRVVNNTVINGRTYGIRVLCSSQTIVGWNRVTGGTNPHIEIGVLQDERFNNGSEDYLAQGVTWIAKDNELIGNITGGNFAYGQMGVYDYTAADKGGPTKLATSMVTKIAGNQFIARSDGKNETFQWSHTAGQAFSGRSLTQLIAAYPSIVQRENVPMNTYVANLLGVPAGEMYAGPVSPPPVPIT